MPEILLATILNLALFDFDGTITTKETFPDFMRLAVSPIRLAFGTALLAPLIVCYRLGLLPGTLVRAVIVRFGLSGVKLAHVQAVAAEFASNAIPALLRPEAMARIEWHKQQGDTVVVVSGGFDLYLKHWCGEHQLALICSELAHNDGVLSGRYAGAQCVSAEKAKRVQLAYPRADFERVYAYGDTKEDLEFLALADEAYYRWRRIPN